ncbi:MAG: PQQ-binding-like beta-propeller repeat protein [Flavobacteriales bacterium]
MKHWILTALLIPSIASAQKEFPKVWETKFNVDVAWKSYTDDLQYVIGGDMSEVEMLDGNTGKSLWTYNFKEKNGVKKCESMKMDDASGTLEVSIQKKGKDAPLETFHLDFRTGQPVGDSELSQREVKVAKSKSKGMRPAAYQSSCTDEATNTTLDLSYDAKRFMSAKGGTDLNLTVTASGGNTWNTSFTGKVVRHLNNDMLPSNEGDVILGVTSGHGKVFVIYEGITCLDIKTGKVLWNTTFDNVQTSGGLKVTQEIGRSAMPLVAADGVYVCDFTKGERTIKKLDLTTGSVIWTADKLKKNDIVSKLILDGGNLVARFGGLIRVEEYIPGMNGNPDVYKVSYSFEGSSALHAFDAATGKPTWDTEAMELGDNFKKSECNIYGTAGRIYACGDKNIYIFDASTGKILKQAEYNAKTIGKATALYAFNGAIMIEGEKGVAQMDAELTPKFATNTGKCLMTEFQGDAFIVWTGKKPEERNEFLRLDPVTGTIMGSISDCRWPHFDPTGDRFVMFDGKKAMLYRTN